MDTANLTRRRPGHAECDPYPQRLFNSIKEAEAELRRCRGQWWDSWECSDEAYQVFGKVFSWDRRLDRVSRVVAKEGDRWVVYDDLLARFLTATSRKP
jgi:hypothetical protein